MPVFSKFSDGDFYLEDTYAPTADVQRAPMMIRLPYGVAP